MDARAATQVAATHPRAHYCGRATDQPASLRRWLVLGGAAVGAVAVAVGMVVWLGSDEAPPVAAPTVSPPAAPTETRASPLATAAAPLDVFGQPGSTEPVETIPEWTALGAPATLLGFDTAVVDGAEWIQVELPAAPHRREEWLPAANVDIASTDVYSSFALGLNGWSEALESFNGGAPQIAVHGTNQPELQGLAVSNGCIRVPNDVATALGAAAPLGTSVVVRQPRVE